MAGARSVLPTRAASHKHLLLAPQAQLVYSYLSPLPAPPRAMLECWAGRDREVAASATAAKA